MSEAEWARELAETFAQSWTGSDNSGQSGNNTVRDQIIRKTKNAAELAGWSLRELSAVLAWLTWARDYINGKDPLLRPIEVPVMANYRDEDLVPFLDSWSPHGPHGMR